MKKSLQKEIKQLIKILKLSCTIKGFEARDWCNVSYQKLSEDFIREFQDRVIWGIVSQYQKLSEDFIREFKDKVDWACISLYQKLSEDFIREFKGKVDWSYISQNQKLSEDFIREFKGKLSWSCISSSQKLSEDFIREFKDEVNWTNISSCQKLSEDFIREFQDKVSWVYVSKYQKLSEDFILGFKDKNYAEIQAKSHKEKSLKQKTKEIKAYAKKHHLKFDGKFLHAFRYHNFNGSGMYYKTIYYEEGKYYQDWHCDMDSDTENSFGLGIFPKGNTEIKVKVEDWGVEVDREDGKARVWGITVGKGIKQ